MERIINVFSYNINGKTFLIIRKNINRNQALAMGAAAPSEILSELSSVGHIKFFYLIIFNMGYN